MEQFGELSDDEYSNMEKDKVFSKNKIKLRFSFLILMVFTQIKNSEVANNANSKEDPSSK